MTVPSQQNEIRHETNGSSVQFSVPFYFIDKSHLRVYLSRDGVDTLLAYGADYLVTGDGDQDGGYISTTTVYAAGASIFIQRILPITQETHYQKNDAFPAQAHERALDKLTMICQQMARIIGFIPGVGSRALLLGPVDKDGEGSYRANGNRIQDLGDPVAMRDGVNKQYVVEALANFATDESGQFVVERLADTTDPRNGAGMVWTKQPEQGAVSRTQSDKNTDIISRKDYATDADFNAANVGRTSIGADGRLDSPVDGPFGEPEMLQSAISRLFRVERSLSSRPAFIEQHISSFFGRGMLPDEVEFIDTETTFTESSPAGVTVIGISDTSKYTIGGCATIRHDNGVYGTYFISNISGTGLAITPPLRHSVSVSGSAIARTWGDKVHPNNFYLRELAQRIAHCSETDAAIPDQASVLFSGFVDNATKLSDSLSLLGGAAVAYFDPSDTGVDGTFKTPVRFSLGKSAHITNIASIGNGVETPFFDTLGVSRACVSVTLSTSSNSTFFMRLTNESGVVVSQHEFTPATAPLPFSKQMFRADIRSSKRVKLSITVGAVGTLPGSIAISQVDVFSQPELAGKVISKQSPVIVCIGDSWVAGSAPREPLTLQLGIELPHAKIINAGVGGQRILEMVNRFDADVAPHQPDYVVVVTGTNESANPFSTVFYPNAVAEYIRLYRIMLEKIASIGARPIIVGAPALSQSVAAFEGRTQNANARGYAHYFAEFLSGKPVAAPRTITVTAGATPDVKGATVVKLNYPSATTVTNFLNGIEGQEIQIEALNGNATLQQFPFLLQGSVNVVLTANSMITLRRRDPVSTGAWVEVSRSIK